MAPTNVLVAYASRHGSTRGVAEHIADHLNAAGHRAELRPVDEVPDTDVYDAVILGSPVYNQAWLPEARAFVRGNADALAGRPIWLFSVGTFGDRKRLIGPLMKREPRGIADLRNDIGPRDYRVFAGIIDRHQWPFLSRVFFWALGGRLGDNRDWPDIAAWADDIGRELARQPVS